MLCLVAPAQSIEFAGRFKTTALLLLLLVVLLMLIIIIMIIIVLTTSVRIMIFVHSSVC